MPRLPLGDVGERIGVFSASAGQERARTCAMVPAAPLRGGRTRPGARRFSGKPPQGWRGVQQPGSSTIEVTAAIIRVERWPGCGYLPQSSNSSRLPLASVWIMAVRVRSTSRPPTRGSGLVFLNHSCTRVISHLERLTGCG